jgi:hypothetical protein
LKAHNRLGPTDFAAVQASAKRVVVLNVDVSSHTARYSPVGCIKQSARMGLDL